MLSHSCRCSFNLNQVSPPPKTFSAGKVCSAIGVPRPDTVLWVKVWFLRCKVLPRGLGGKRTGLCTNARDSSELRNPQSPCSPRVVGRLLCREPQFLLPSLCYKMKLEEQSLLNVQDWSQKDSLSFDLGWGFKSTVHLITFINMATCHALVLWDCSLRTVSLRLPTQNLFREPYSMTFKLKTGEKKKTIKPL